MEVVGLLKQFYTELRTVEGLSENGAETYVRSAGLFLMKKKFLWLKFL